jgi:hypothetical protein
VALDNVECVKDTDLASLGVRSERIPQVPLVSFSRVRSCFPVRLVYWSTVGLSCTLPRLLGNRMRSKHSALLAALVVCMHDRYTLHRR